MQNNIEFCNYTLSMAVDLQPQIRLSVVLDERKRPACRPFRQISVRAGGIVAAINATMSGPSLSSERGFFCSFCLGQCFSPFPSPESLVSGTPPQMVDEARFKLGAAGCPFYTGFRV
ncbi:hypothetical protein ASF69_08920 [Rhizobium sp. Leaf311]|nr:hypothetical protein ASF69_08920 [Rhizobium sp. Leaf311]